MLAVTTPQACGVTASVTNQSSARHRSQVPTMKVLDATSVSGKVASRPSRRYAATSSRPTSPPVRGPARICPTTRPRPASGDPATAETARTTTARIERRKTEENLVRGMGQASLVERAPPAASRTGRTLAGWATFQGQRRTARQRLLAMGLTLTWSLWLPPSTW